MNISVVTMASAKEYGRSGCFSSVLRHLLCLHGASMHPSDVIDNLDSDPSLPSGRCLKEEAKLGGGEDELGGMSSSGRRVGVIARLMGLETLPDVKWVPGLKSPVIFSRSRSADFIDNLLEADLSSRQARRHRHRRTSASFGEVPLSVQTLGPEQKEKNLIVVILDNRGELPEEEIIMRGKSRKNEVKRRTRKKKTISDSQSREENMVSNLSDEPKTRSKDGCNSEFHWTNNARAAYEKKRGSSYRYLCNQLRHSPREVRTSYSTAVRTARILDPVISRKKKATTKRKNREVKSLGSGKQMDDAVKIAQGFAGAEAGNSCRLSSGSSDLEEISVKIEGHVLDCLLDEFCENECV